MRATMLSLTLAMACFATACMGPKATEVASAPAPAPTTPSPPGRHLFCETSEVTGTKLSTRECHTAEEWASIREHQLEGFKLDTARQMPSKGGD
jgi:hypothetical protein